MYAYAAGGGSSRSPRIFVSYVHQDEKLCRKLLAHLRVLERRRGIDVWHYKKIVPGDDWQGAIHQELARADVILLLLSPEFVDSDYCWDVEVSHALERQRKNEARVIPVLLRPVAAWQKTPVGRLHALPRNGKPVSEWRNRDEAFAEIVDGIEHALLHWRPKPPARSEEGVQWGLQVESGIAEDDTSRLAKLRIALRKLTGDWTLELLTPIAGSGILAFRSRQKSLKTLERLHERGALGPKLGLEVRGIGKKIGAVLRIAFEEAREEPESSAMVELPPVVRPAEPGYPPLVLGMVVLFDNPIQPGFKLGADPARPPMSREEQVEVAARLRSYLNAALVAEPGSLTVDLNPYQEYCGIPPVLGRTELGRDLLAQDVVLKHFTAGLLHPEAEAGKAFWAELEGPSAGRQEMDAWLRVWITPDQVSLRETGHEGSLEVTLERIGFKVQCEPDYKAFEYLRREGLAGVPPSAEASRRAVAVFKEKVLPLVHREVCLGDRFGVLRQILTVVILAKWYRQSPLAEPLRRAGFLDSNDTGRFQLNVIEDEPAQIREVYLRLLRDGVWRFARTAYDRARNEVVRRVYLAGGVDPLADSAD